jgi:2-dehydro-3-deoxyphosphooctonate aldolase (KDO 8-P synthase)
MNIIIAGPCQIESVDQGNIIATVCKFVCEKYGYDYYFKSSFDKANRTSISGHRGMGLKEGIDAIFKVSQQVQVKTCVDFHDVDQIRLCEDWGWLPDIIQIPAFLCRQTDLLLAAVQTGKLVNIKKGQFLAPWDVTGILSKTGTENVMITERGTSFGYNTLVVDYTGLEYMLNNYDVPIVFDGTHAVQKPGGQGSSSGGNRDYVPGLCRAAAALGVRNYFLEVHEDPDNAPSDGPNMLWLSDFENVLRDIKDYQYERGQSMGNHGNLIDNQHGRGAPH